MRHEHHDLHGDGGDECEVYDVAPGWEGVTDIPCPVAGCAQTIVWYEAGYVPGYRVCMTPVDGDRFDAATLRHRFIAGIAIGRGNVLIRDGRR